MTKQEFLEKQTESNTEWVALQIASNYPRRQFKALLKQIKQLDEILYKSWAKDMTLSEIMEAITIVDELE